MTMYYAAVAIDEIKRIKSLMITDEADEQTYCKHVMDAKNVRKQGRDGRDTRIQLP